MSAQIAIQFPSQGLEHASWHRRTTTGLHHGVLGGGGLFGAWDLGEQCEYAWVGAVHCRPEECASERVGGEEDQQGIGKYKVRDISIPGSRIGLMWWC